ncbi:MAG: SpoIIE family protein phosphatase [Bacteroidales bacterium]|nr:SpoIIE family protein phosphatase [Bacteroidales bacterium]MCF8389110.1 SpoIIE family protein phosphatase [Bacteroidales bacterium]
MTYMPIRFLVKNIRLFRRIFFLSCLFLSLNVEGQNYFFDSYSVAEGLAQSTVFDILQDQNDYVWLGTRAGVSRFDGQEFINFTAEDGLAVNSVRIIFQQKNSNNIWFGHVGGGISFYDGHVFHEFSKGETFTSDITGFVFDSDGNFWISSEGSGAVKIKSIKKTLEESVFEIYKGNDLSDRIFGILKTSDNKLLFLTDAFVKKYDAEKNVFESFNMDGMPTFFQITSLYEDSKKNLWFGTFHGGLYKYDAELGSFKIYDIRDGLSSNWISNVGEDRNGNTWVGTWGGGITLISPDGLKIYNQENGLPDTKIRRVLEDREGNMLIGSNENGLVIYKGDEFISYFVEDGLVNSQVWAIEQDETGKYWFGTNQGISILNPKNKQFTNFYKLKENGIRFLKKDSKNRMWIATDNQGIFTQNLNNGVFTYEPGLNSYLSSLIVTALEADNRGIIWVGALDALVGYDYDTRTAVYFTQTSGLSTNEVTALYFSEKSERLWIGTRDGGLNYYEGDSIYQLNLEETFTPTSITSDNDGSLWLGTEAKGVLKIDTENSKILKDFKVSDGLLANLINLVEVDEMNNVYIGTNKGLNIYDQNRDKLLTYNNKNGFVGIETKPSAVHKDTEGNLWFGTVLGATRYDPDKMKKQVTDPLTHIISIKVNLQDRDLTPGLTLKYTENDVVIDYISMCLTNPDAVAYKIMLEGAENDWRPVTRQTRVTYPSLAPRKYTFKVIGRNNEGTWNSEPISFSFQIRPPFYLTVWFIITVLTLITAAIISYIKIRERNLLIEKRILEDKVRERTAEVVAQKEELAEKNKDITDSIRYAKRIQVAILPPKIPFDDTFVLFKPKDIVSGDFYWFEVVGDREFMAAVDCTGHGVPGAFMSIIGTNLLNKIVKERGIYKPSEIIDTLNEEVIHNLKSGDEGSKVYDGMDLALVCYNRRTGQLEYAGAYNPLLIVRNNDIEEIKADRFGVGRSSRVEEARKFTNNEVQINKGETIYIFSDGFADQFGGDTGKKFKSKPMKELFLAVYEKPLDVQQEILEKTLEAWRGNIEQVDDVLIIGRRF